jgi:hypothetical protein
MAENLLKWIARSLVCKVIVVVFHWWRKKWMDENLFKWICPFISAVRLMFWFFIDEERNGWMNFFWNELPVHYCGKVNVVIFHWWRKKWMDENLLKWNCLFIRSNKGQHSQAHLCVSLVPVLKLIQPSAGTWPWSYTKFFFTQTPIIFSMEEDAFLVQPN